jgi:uncharacterized protein (DUF2249 family)
MTAASAEITAVLDVRGLPCANRRAIIFGHFDSLNPGQAIEIVNDHDPVGLKSHFAERAPDGFGWRPLEAGPDVWRIEIARC